MAGAQSHAFGDVPAKGFSRVTSEEPLVTVRPESLISGVRHSSACWSRACPQSCLIVSFRFHDLVQPVPPSEVSLGAALNYGPAVSAEKKGTLAVPLLASSFPVLRAAIGSGFLDLRHFLGSLHLPQRPVCPHLGNNKYSFRSKCWWSPCSPLVLCSSVTEPLNGTGTHPTVSIFGVTVQDEPKPLQNSCSNCCPGSARRDSCAAPAGHRLLCALSSWIIIVSPASPCCVCFLGANIKLKPVGAASPVRPPLFPCGVISTYLCVLS